MILAVHNGGRVDRVVMRRYSKETTMDEKILQVIQALAEKLGTTTEHLWSVLVTQAPISGAINLASCVLMLTGAVLWTLVVYRKTKTPPETPERGYQYPEWDDEGAAFAWLSALCVWGFVAAIVALSAPLIAAAFFNPEYWALKQLI